VGSVATSFSFVNDSSVELSSGEKHLGASPAGLKFLALILIRPVEVFTTVLQMVVTLDAAMRPEVSRPTSNIRPENADILWYMIVSISLATGNTILTSEGKSILSIVSHRLEWPY
jgi:hypothetical protein